MQVITVFNEKGGVGKTSITSNVGGGLALRGHKVLLIDADGQGNLTKVMGEEKAPDFFKFAKWETEQTRGLIRPVRDEVCKGFIYIVAGNDDTWGIPTSSRLKPLIQLMRNRFAQLARIFDYVLIDTQPSASMLHEAILPLTDWFLCPTDPEPLSALDGLVYTVSSIREVREDLLARGHDKARIMGIVPNKFRKNTVLHDEIIKDMKTTYGDLVWEPIPLRTNIPEAQFKRAILMQDAPDLETNNHLWRLVERVEATSQAVRSE